MKRKERLRSFLEERRREKEMMEEGRLTNRAMK